MAYNKVVYNGNTLIDLTSDTATEADVVSGKKFHKANGQQATGTYTGGGSAIQYSPVMAQVKNKTSYTTTNSKITVAQSGTYKCSWVNYAYAAGSSSTYATQLYKNSSAVGSVHNAPAYSGTSNFVATENSISLNAGDTIEVRARTRSGSNYYTTAGMLVIEKI